MAKLETLESLRGTLANQNRTSLHFAAASGTPRVPHALRAFCEHAALAFVRQPVFIREGLGTLNFHLLTGTDRTSFPPGPAGHVRTFTVFQGLVTVHQEGFIGPGLRPSSTRLMLPHPESAGTRATPWFW